MDFIEAGHVPLKFAYAGSAAYTHDQYANTIAYTDMMASAAEESGTLVSSGLCRSPVHSVAEVGPGNGLHSVALLRHLAALGVPVNRYLGMDFSATLLNITCTRLRQCFGTELVVDAKIWDIEDQSSMCVEHWRIGTDALLVCLLGHTLGNTEDPAQALTNLRTSLRDDDILLASVLLRRAVPPAEQDFAAYRTAEFRQAALEPLLAAGLDPRDLEFTVRYENDAFIGEALLLRDARLQHANLSSGFRVRCFLSRRFDAPSVLRMFEQTGWSVRTAALDVPSDHMTVVALRTQEPR